MAFSIDIRDRILLYLLELSSVYGRADKPVSLTLEVMAESIGRSRSSVSRYVPRLEAEGLVKAWKDHVEGAKKIRKVVVLTSDGIERAIVRRDEILDSEVPLEGVPQVLRSVWPHDESLVRWLIALEAGHLGPGPEPEQEQRPNLPGRARELGSMMEWARSGGPVLIVSGRVGIGKTALVSAFRDSIDPGEWAGIHWHTIPRGGQSRESLESALQGALVNPEASAESPREGPGRRPWLVILDGLPEGDPCTLVPDHRLVVISRTVPGGLSPMDLIEDRVRVLPLGDLPLEIMTGEVSPEDGQRVERWGGWPLALKLDDPDLSKIVRGEILRSLSERERATLDILSVVNDEIGVEQLPAVPGMDLDIVEQLRLNGLVSEVPGGFVVPPSLSSTLIRDLGPAQKRELHRVVMNALKEFVCTQKAVDAEMASLESNGIGSGSTAWVRDAELAALLVWHAVEAGDHESWVCALVPGMAQDRKLDWNGAGGLLRSQLDWFVDPSIGQPGDDGHAVIMARSGHRLEADQDALAMISRAVDRAGKTPAQAVCRALLGHRMITSEEKRGIPVLDQALEEAVWSGDQVVMIECQLWKVRALIESGEHGQARNMLDRLLSETRRLQLDVMLGQVMEEMGRLAVDE